MLKSVAHYCKLHTQLTTTSIIFQASTAEELVCRTCSDQLHSFWLLRKKVLFTDLIWQNYETDGRSKTVIPLDYQLEFHCHLCPSSTLFLYEDLQGHIADFHGQDHLKSCRLCESIVEFPAERTAPESVQATEEDEDDGEEKLKTRRHSNRKTPSKTKKHSKPSPEEKTRGKSSIRRSKVKAHPSSKDSPKTLSRSITCRECTETFYCGEALEDHLKAVHDVLEILHELPIATLSNRIDSPNQRPFGCHICHNVTYAKRDKLVVHLRQKHKIVLKRKPEQNVCHICDQVLSSSKSLRRHLRMKHEIDDSAEKRRKSQQFVCPTCGKTFSAMVTFDAHLQQHTPLPFLCTVCEVAAFRSRSERKEHELPCQTISSTSSVQYLCLSCNASEPLDGIDRLKGHHLEVHSQASSEGGKNEMKVGYSCCLCLERLSSMPELLAHLDQHGQATCRVCSKDYANTARLKSHFVKSHCGTASLVCTECGQVLSRPDKLIEHMWTHTGFTCGVCKMVFKKRKEVQQHRREQHGKAVLVGEVIEEEDMLEDEDASVKVEILDVIVEDIVEELVEFS